MQRPPPAAPASRSRSGCASSKESRVREWGWRLPNDVGAEEERAKRRYGAGDVGVDADVVGVDVGILRREVHAQALEPELAGHPLIERVPGGDVANAPVRPVGVEPRRRVQ